jgi:hypothetical protein
MMSRYPWTTARSLRQLRGTTGLISYVVATRQQILAALESNILKNKMIRPGERLGAAGDLTPPASDGERADHYVIGISTGGEAAEPAITQGAHLPWTAA